METISRPLARDPFGRAFCAQLILDAQLCAGKAFQNSTVLWTEEYLAPAEMKRNMFLFTGVCEANELRGRGHNAQVTHPYEFSLPTWGVDAQLCAGKAFQNSTVLWTEEYLAPAEMKRNTYMGVSENGVYPAWNTPELILDTDD